MVWQTGVVWWAAGGRAQARQRAGAREEQAGGGRLGAAVGVNAQRAGQPEQSGQGEWSVQG